MHGTPRNEVLAFALWIELVATFGTQRSIDPLWGGLSTVLSSGGGFGGKVT